MAINCSQRSLGPARHLRGPRAWVAGLATICCREVLALTDSRQQQTGRPARARAAMTLSHPLTAGRPSSSRSSAWASARPPACSPTASSSRLRSGLHWSSRQVGWRSSLKA